MVRVRLDERLHARVVEAAATEARDLSGWIREAIMERLGTASSAEAERVALLKEARAFLAVTPGTSAADREAHSLVQRYVQAIEAQAGRLSLAEQRGRARALAEIADGALEPLDGEVVSVGPYGIGDERELPTVLETTTPRRRGYLRAALAVERSRALLQRPAPPAAPMSPPPSTTAMLGERAARELFRQAIGWGNAKSVFCPVHAVVPHAPERPDRCCYGCRINPSDNGPEAS
jgi:hypothetical protein